MANHPLEFNADTVREILADFYRRCELIKLIGGVALRDVVNGDATVPPGWVMDRETCFFVPPDFTGNISLQ